MARQGQMRLRVALQHRNMVEPPPVRGNHIKFMVAEHRYHLVKLRAKGIKPVTQAEMSASVLKANSEGPRIFADLAEYARLTEQHAEATRFAVDELLQLEQTRFNQGR